MSEIRAEAYFYTVLDAAATVGYRGAELGRVKRLSASSTIGHSDVLSRVRLPSRDAIFNILYSFPNVDHLDVTVPTRPTTDRQT